MTSTEASSVSTLTSRAASPSQLDPLPPLPTDKKTGNSIPELLAVSTTNAGFQTDEGSSLGSHDHSYTSKETIYPRSLPTETSNLSRRNSPDRKVIPVTGQTSPNQVDLLSGSPDNGDRKRRMEIYISRLRRDIPQLETVIRDLELEKADLHDWLIDQLTAARATEDSSHYPLISSEANIKQCYQKRNSELKHQLANLQSRLSDTRFAVSHLETHELPSNMDAKTYIQSILKEHRRGGGDTTKVAASISNKTSAESEADSAKITPPLHPESTKLRRFQEANDPTDESLSPGRSGVYRMSPSRSLANLPSGVIGPHPLTSEKSRTMPTTTTVSSSCAALTTSKILPLDAMNSARVTRIKPVTSSGLLGRPDSPSLLSQSGGTDECPTTSDKSLPGRSRFYLEQPSQSQIPPQENPFVAPISGPSTPPKSTSNSKKSRTSMKGAFKHGLTYLGRPFRKTEVSTAPQRSASEENLRANVPCDALSPAHDPNLCKSPSSVSTRNLGFPLNQPSSGVSTTSKHKKLRGHGNSASDFHDHTGSHKKKSHPGSISSGNGALGPRDSVSGISGDPNNMGVSGGDYVTEGDIDQNNIISSILEVLSGGPRNLTSPPTSHVLAIPSSGSSQSGGLGNRLHHSNANLSSLPGVSAAACGASASHSTTTPPLLAYNVAMALMMMNSHYQSIIDAQEASQQKMLADLKEDISGARQDMVGCRDKVNSVAVEVKALGRDMQTKEELQNQNLSDAISRLEQLDARVEEWRQTVRQEFVNLQKEQRRTIDPLEYQLTTKTRDLQDDINTLSNKVNIMEKSMEQISNLSRDRPYTRRLVLHTLTDLGVSLFAFITALIQILIKFLNAGATVTQNRAAIIILNIGLLCFLLFVFFSEPLFRWWRHEV